MSVNSAAKRILILGTVERERCGLREMLHQRSRLRHAEIRTGAQLDVALSWTIRDGWVPDLVVLISGYPRAWSESELTSLWDVMPLARWIVVQDGWTRSALRHLPWLPAGSCVPRERLWPRLRQELAVLDGQRPPLPLTASLDELFARDTEWPVARTLDGLRAGLFTPDRDLRSWLRELLNSLKVDIVPLEMKPAAVLWDLDPWNTDRQTQLEIYRRRDPDCTIVGLRNTVHELAIHDAGEHGVDWLISKQMGTGLIVDALAARCA